MKYSKNIECILFLMGAIILILMIYKCKNVNEINIDQNTMDYLDSDENLELLDVLVNKLRMEEYVGNNISVNEALNIIEIYINSSWDFGEEKVRVYNTVEELNDKKILIVLRHAKVRDILYLIGDQTGLSYIIDSKKFEIRFRICTDIIVYSDDDDAKLPILTPPD